MGGEEQGRGEALFLLMKLETGTPLLQENLVSFMATGLCVHLPGVDYRRDEELMGVLVPKVLATLA